MKRINTVISIVTGALVLLVAISAFILSFDALVDLVLDMGVDPRMAWLYPAIIDGAIIVFSLSVLRANLSHEKTQYPWILVGVFTILSTVLNVIHAEHNPLAQFLAAVPPIALFLAFELLMTQVKGMTLRLQVVQTLEEVTEMVVDAQLKLDELRQQKESEMAQFESEIERMRLKKSELVNEIKILRQQLMAEKASDTGSIEQAREVRASKKEAAKEQLIEYLHDHPNASLSEMAEAIGRAKSTVGGYVKEFLQMKILRKEEGLWIISKNTDYAK